MKPVSSDVLAIDIGGTKLETALVSPDGTIVPGSRHRRPTGARRSRSEIAAALVEAVELSLAASPDGAVAAGIGSAGPVDLPAGTISPHNLPALRDLAVQEVVETASGLPSTLRLDGTCIALAEHWLGAARGTRTSMSMVVSTGVGGGIISDGRLLAGASGNAGHVGQIHVAVAVERDDPAERSTLEAVASGPSTVRWAREQGWHGASGEDLAVDVALGRPVAEAATRRSAEFVGQAIASAATLLDLETVVIGGGFARVRPDYLDIVRASVRRNAIFEYAARVVVLPSGLSGDGPLLGAAALVHRAEYIGAVVRDGHADVERGRREDDLAADPVAHAGQGRPSSP